MKGTPHEIYTNSLMGKGVGLENQYDCSYACLFETRQEIDNFIGELKKARDEAFGKAIK